MNERETAKQLLEAAMDGDAVALRELTHTLNLRCGVVSDTPRVELRIMADAERKSAGASMAFQCANLGIETGGIWFKGQGLYRVTIVRESDSVPDGLTLIQNALRGGV